MSKNKKIPRHIALVLDGNRRYADKKGKERFEGHQYGAKKVKKLMMWAKELGIKELTLYSFSTENFYRPRKEVKYLFDLFRKSLRNLKEDKKKEMTDIRIDFIGRIERFPKDMYNQMVELREKTKRNKRLKVNFALAYGSRDEIVDAVNKLLKRKARKISKRLLQKSLELSSEPDLLIRPGGEKRISNFLLWQMAYTELYFLNKFWPEFTKKDLMKAISWFNERERRFGR